MYKAINAPIISILPGKLCFINNLNVYCYLHYSNIEMYMKKRTNIISNGNYVIKCIISKVPIHLIILTNLPIFKHN